jgi:predicted nuclease of predicted toxin-antitoxin system
VGALASAYPASTHVTAVGLAGAADQAIWAYARAHGFVIVTKDEDFVRLSVVQGFPPKVIWIGLGNCSTAEVAELLRAHVDQVTAFAQHEEAAFLALG